MKSLSTYIFEATTDSELEEFKKKYKQKYNSVGHRFKQKNDILVITNCSMEKHKDLKDGPMEAGKAYVGDGFSWMNFALSKIDFDWLIVSGGYGLISNHTEIDEYEGSYHTLSTAALRKITDFCRYQQDLLSIVKASKYKKIIFAMARAWYIMFDFKELKEAAGDDCEFIGFVTDETVPVPDDMINLRVSSADILKRIGAVKIVAKERFTMLYLLKMAEKGINVDVKNFYRTCNWKDFEELTDKD